MGEEREGGRRKREGEGERKGRRGKEKEIRSEKGEGGREGGREEGRKRGGEKERKREKKGKREMSTYCTYTCMSQIYLPIGITNKNHLMQQLPIRCGLRPHLPHNKEELLDSVII